MNRNEIGKQRVEVKMDVNTVSLVHKLMAVGKYHARLSDNEWSNAERGQAIFENLLLQSGFYSPTELRMVLDSCGKLIMVAR